MPPSTSRTLQTLSHHLFHHPHQTLANPTTISRRTFIDTLLSKALQPPPLRHLTHTKTLPYSSTSIFQAVADVSGYPSFLPFTTASRVTQRDENGYPKRASLRIGYDKFGLEEVWESQVRCDPKEGVVEARSGDGESDVKGGGNALFEVLQTKWVILPKKGAEKYTTVKLDLDVKFRNPLYDQMFAQVEGKIADVMINAFEQRVRELEAEAMKK